MASDVDISGCWDYGAFGREISMGGGVERRTKMNEWKDPRRNRSMIGINKGKTPNCRSVREST